MSRSCEVNERVHSPKTASEDCKADSRPSTYQNLYDRILTIKVIILKEGTTMETIGKPQ